jgi:hypothetical protein
MVGRRTAALVLSGSLYGLMARAEPGAEHPDADAQRAASHADAATEARLAFEEGVKRIQKSDWAGAEPLLRRSAELLPRASSLYDLALCLFKLERLEEAVAILDQLLATDADPADAKYRLYADTLRHRAMEQLGTLVLTIDPDGAELRVDGTLRAGTGARRQLLLRPGRHELSFSAAGHRSASMELNVVAGDQNTRTISLPADLPLSAIGPAAMPPAQPAPVLGTAVTPPRSDPQPDTGHNGSSVLPWILIGTGAASLIGAAVTGGLALKADNDFVSKCSTLQNCNPEDAALRDRAQNLALASDILLGVGLAAGAAGAVIWWVNLPSDPKKQSGINGITVGLRTSF